MSQMNRQAFESLLTESMSILDTRAIPSRVRSFVYKILNDATVHYYGEMNEYSGGLVQCPLHSCPKCGATPTDLRGHVQDKTKVPTVFEGPRYRELSRTNDGNSFGTLEWDCMFCRYKTESVCRDYAEPTRPSSLLPLPSVPEQEVEPTEAENLVHPLSNTGTCAHGTLIGNPCAECDLDIPF